MIAGEPVNGQDMIETTAVQAAVLAQLAGLITAVVRPHPLRVGIDGYSASGKTTLADRLVRPIEACGRSCLRASLDHFKRPWAERHRYDRESGAGYYRNAYDYALIRDELLVPLGSGGHRRFRSAHIDPLTQRHIESATGVAAENAVMRVDGVFLFRPELNDLWDFRIFVDIDVAQVLERGARRDEVWMGSHAAAVALYRERYIPSEEIYVAAVGPHALANVIVDDRDLTAPRIVVKRQGG